MNHGAIIILVAGASVGFAGTRAAAQTQADRQPFSVSVLLASDYRSKGASKTGGRPQAAITLERPLAGDTYLAASASNIRNTAGSDAQVNLTVGWRPEALGFKWDFDSTHEIYPGSDTQANDVVWQLSAEASRRWGPLTATMVLQHQPDGFAETGANTYAAASGSWRLQSNLNLVGGLGRREQDNSVDYTAWNAGMVVGLPRGAALDLRWYATDQDVRGPNYRDRLVGALKLNF